MAPGRAQTTSCEEALRAATYPEHTGLLKVWEDVNFSFQIRDELRLF